MKNSIKAQQDKVLLGFNLFYISVFPAFKKQRLCLQSLFAISQSNKASLHRIIQ